MLKIRIIWRYPVSSRNDKSNQLALVIEDIRVRSKNQCSKNHIRVEGKKFNQMNEIVAKSNVRDQIAMAG